jgi:hypothetical protein
MGRRKGQVRFGYKKLSLEYRKRLERNGVSQKEWEDGADLRKARGHARDGLKPLSEKEKKAIEKAVRSDLTPQELKELEKTIKIPSWIPKGTRIEVAAALSQLPDPKTWRHAYFTPKDDGEPWTLTVYKKRSKYPLIIEIPGGGGSEGEAPREAIEAVKATKIEYDSERKDLSPENIFWSVMDTDRPAPKK